MSITPGVEPAPKEDQPLLAEDPLPPGSENLAEKVEKIDTHVRAGGPDEVEEADAQADQVERDADSQERSGGGSAADADRDPTSDEGADPEDPEAQRGEEPGTSGAVESSG